MIRNVLRAALMPAICASILCAATAPLGAQPPLDGRTHWGIARIQGVMTFPVGNDHAEIWNDCGGGFFDFLNFAASVDVNTSGGVLASFEYVLKERYGLELGFHWWRQFVDLSFEADGFTVEGAPNFILPTLGFNYHLLPGSAADLYVGALATLGVIATGLGTDIEVSKDFALGLNFGVDYYVSDRWFIGGTAKYIDFGALDFTLLPPGIGGIICDNGLFGIGSLGTVSLTCGAGYRF
jgi:opacity protein-like surface antigen